MCGLVIANFDLFLSGNKRLLLFRRRPGVDVHMPNVGTQTAPPACSRVDVGIFSRTVLVVTSIIFPLDDLWRRLSSKDVECNAFTRLSPAMKSNFGLADAGHFKPCELVPSFIVAGKAGASRELGPGDVAFTW